ncbi:MAG: fibronectin type III domain-containing protein [Nanoarchaeota archaeon]|nr:fibronectin type III domain-containing protein [Nanoarchaeota archaeon]
MRFVLLIVLMMGLVSAGTMICVDLDSPPAPANLGVTSSGMNIVLTWDAVVDEPSCSGIEEYVISRNGVEIGRTSGDVLTFTDEGLAYGTYSYSVFAIDRVAHNSGPAIKNDVVLSAPSSGGGSVHVSSGGGSSSYACSEKWSCQDWTDCSGGEQRRLCDDLNECGTFKNKPEIFRECGLELGNATLVSANAKTPNIRTFSSMTGAVIGAAKTPAGVTTGAFIILALGSFFLVRFKRKL